MMRLDLFLWGYVAPPGFTLSGALLLRVAAWLWPLSSPLAVVVGAVGLVIGGLGLAMLYDSTFGD